MSVVWLSEVWESSPYEGTRLLIHLAMADHANADGWFFASQKNLAKKARCSVEYLRQTIAVMKEDKLLELLKKGSSKGRSTEYRLLPNRVTPQQSYSPTSGNELPNSDPLTPQLCSVSTVINNQPNTTNTDGKDAASVWWESQSVKPIGKNAWFALVKVCEAAAARGYSLSQIISALDSIGTVPTIAQMDRVLKNIPVATQSRRQQRLSRGLENIALLEESPLLEITE